MEIIDLQDYTIQVGAHQEALKDLLEQRQYTNIAVLVDENTAKYCLPHLTDVLQYFPHFIIQIKSGERNKNLHTCSDIWTKLMNKNIDRRSLLINLGGGVIGDMGGFCASTFKRGMDFVQVPTTLLSQVDASIGGKLGIDFNQVKNSVGVFNNPQSVLIDSSFLATLPLREIRSGLAEIIKHSLIANQKQWSELLKIQDLSSTDWSKYLIPSLKIKQIIVEADPFERGMRKALNFGHTVGHAIESVALETDGPLLHGEAIAIGMIAEAYLSFKKNNLPESELKEITSFIKRIYEPESLRAENYPTYIDLMQKDKKNEGAEINFTLLDEIGKCSINQTASPTEIKESLEYFNKSGSA